MTFHKPDMEKQSKHASIFLDIAKSIRSGKLRAGEKTPSENDIIAAYGVSNTTARKALSELERAGLAKRVRGKGTVVTAGGKTLTREIGSFDAFKGSFSENLVREGFIPKVEIVESGVVSDFCGAAIGGNFYEIKGKIFKIRMLRYGGALLLKDETRYLNLDLCDGIQKLGDFDPLALTLESQFGIRIEKVARAFSVVDACKSKYFPKKQKSLIFLEGACLTKNGEVVEMESSYYNAERYKFSIETRA